VLDLLGSKGLACNKTKKSPTNVAAGSKALYCMVTHPEPCCNKNAHTRWVIYAWMSCLAAQYFHHCIVLKTNSAGKLGCGSICRQTQRWIIVCVSDQYFQEQRAAQGNCHL